MSFQIYIKEIFYKISYFLSSCLFISFIFYQYKYYLIYQIIQFSQLQVYFIYTDITEIFIIIIKIIKIYLIPILIFFLIFQILIFIKPGLYQTEYKRFKKRILICLSYWIVNYYIIIYYNLPFIYKFCILYLLNNNLIELYFESQLLNYLNFFIIFYFYNFFLTNIFLLIFFLLNYINVSYTKIRKIIYLCIFCFNFIILPDLIFQIYFIIICLCNLEILYFLNILINLKNKLPT